MQAIGVLRAAVVLGGLLAIAGGRNAVAGQPSTAPPAASSQSIQSQSMSLAAPAYGWWEAGEGGTTVLTLKNPGQTSVGATVVAYSDGGQQAGKTQVEIAPHGVLRLSIASLVSTREGTQQGGLVVQSNDADRPVSGRVMVAQASGSRIAYSLNGGYRYDSENQLSAPWWLPDAGTDGRISLFNVSDRPIVVTPSVGAKGVQKAARPVAVAPNARQTLSLRSLLEEAGVEAAEVGLVTFRYAGPSRALQPSLLLTNSSTGFALLAGINASHLQQAAQQSTWQFPFVSIANESAGEKLTAYALLSNSTGSRMAPQLTAYAADKGTVRQFDLPVAALEPGETSLVDLSEMVREFSLPSTVGRIGLSVSHGGQPGDLSVSIFSVTASRHVLAGSEGFVLSAGTGTVSYWDISGGEVLLHEIGSLGGGAASGQATLYYQTPDGLQSYVLPATLVVSAGKSSVINVTQLVRSGVPDENGLRPSAGVTSGLVALSSVESPAGAAVLMSNDSAFCAASCSLQPRASLSPTGSPLVFRPNIVAPACGPPAISVGLSPDTVTMSTGDTNKTFTVTITPSGAVGSNLVFSTKATSNPNSSSAASLSIPGASSVSGSQNFTISASPAGGSGIFGVIACASAVCTQNVPTVTVPPQIFIQMLYGEAHGQTQVGDTVSEPAIGSSVKNRFGNSAFTGGSTATYQAVIVSSQYNGIATSITSGQEPELDVAAALFSGAQSDTVAGSPCFFSPTANGWTAIQAALNSGTTTVPTVSFDPNCFGSNRQLVYKSSIGANANGSGAPAFIFERQKSSSSNPAVVQIQ